MIFWSDYIQKIPVLGDFFKNNYFTLKRYYVNFIRKTSIRPGPVYVNWIATNRCNSRCVYCEASANQIKSEELSTDQILGVVKELGELKVKQFFVIGGEPLLRKDLFEVLHYAKKQGMEVGFFTNSLLFKKFKKEIKQAGLQNIWTSIDGMENTHNENRGYLGGYEITMEAMEYYTSINIPLRVINTVVHNGNFDELPDLFEQVKRSGANWWRLGAVLPVGRAKNNQFGLSAERTLRLFQYIEKARKFFNVTISEEMGYLGCWDNILNLWPFFCHAGLTFCAITPRGDIVPCQVDDNRKYSEGNIQEKPFKEIWKHGFGKFRHARLEEKCSTCIHRSACSGGCWIQRVKKVECLRGLWDFENYG